MIHKYLHTVTGISAESRFWACLTPVQQLQLCGGIKHKVVSNSVPEELALQPEFNKCYVIMKGRAFLQQLGDESDEAFNEAVAAANAPSSSIDSRHEPPAVGSGIDVRGHGSCFGTIVLPSCITEVMHEVHAQKAASAREKKRQEYKARKAEEALNAKDEAAFDEVLDVLGLDKMKDDATNRDESNASASKADGTQRERRASRESRVSRQSHEEGRASRQSHEERRASRQSHEEGRASRQSHEEGRASRQSHEGRASRQSRESAQAGGDDVGSAAEANADVLTEDENTHNSESDSVAAEIMQLADKLIINGFLSVRTAICIVVFPRPLLRRRLYYVLPGHRSGDIPDWDLPSRLWKVVHEQSSQRVPHGRQGR